MSAKVLEYVKNHKKTLIIGVILNLVTLYYFWLLLFSGDFLMPYSKNAKNREALLKIRESIQISDDYEKVLKTYWLNDSCKLNLSLSAESSESWTVSMPLEFGATDWRMYIKFQDTKVVGHKIRNSDGMHPKDAPEDVGETDE